MFIIQPLCVECIVKRVKIVKCAVQCIPNTRIHTWGGSCYTIRTQLFGDLYSFCIEFTIQYYIIDLELLMTSFHMEITKM